MPIALNCTTERSPGFQGLWPCWEEQDPLLLQDSVLLPLLDTLYIRLALYVLSNLSVERAEADLDAQLKPLGCCADSLSSAAL